MAKTNEISGNILVLDDEKTNIDIIKNAISLDYKLYYSLKPDDAFKILKRINIDLMLLDVVMPEMDGYEFCKKMKSEDTLKNIPIIFITGKNDISSVIKGFEEGAVDYIAKPFEILELKARVRSQMELQKTKRQLENTNKELVKLNATKDRLFSIIGHDLRGPVGGLDSILQFMIETRDMGIEETRKYIKELKSYSSFAINLLENLLNWAIAQEKQSVVNYKFFNLRDIIIECSGVLSMAANKKNIMVKNEVDKDIAVEADKEMIMTIIRNLLSNALKFTAQNGEVTINASGDGYNTKISVTDNGTGIAREKLENIFNTDKDNSTAGTDGEKGTGLGLFLCRELVEKHNGEIMAESEEGKGSTFTFTLPKVKD